MCYRIFSALCQQILGPSSSVAGQPNATPNYKFFNNYSPMMNIDSFQPKYSYEGTQNGTQNISGNTPGIITETPSAPVNLDKVLEREVTTPDAIKDENSLLSWFNKYDKKVNDGNITLKKGDDGNWTKKTVTTVNNNNNLGTFDISGNDTFRKMKDFSKTVYVTEMENAGARMIQAYDTNNDGVISYEEYEKFKTNGKNDNESDAIKTPAKNMFEKLDFNNSGAIDYQEMASYLAYLDQGVSNEAYINNYIKTELKTHFNTIKTLIDEAQSKDGAARLKSIETILNKTEIITSEDIEVLKTKLDGITLGIKPGKSEQYRSVVKEFAKIIKTAKIKNLEKSDYNATFDEEGDRNGIISSPEYLFNSENLIRDGKSGARKTLQESWDYLFGEVAQRSNLPRV